MSYPTYRYADILSENLRTLRSSNAVEILLHVTEPLLDSARIIKEQVTHAALYQLMLFTAALHLYEQGRKEFYFPELMHVVTNEITDESVFDMYSDLCSNFDYLVNGGSFMPAPTGRKKYMLNARAQQKLDEILQNRRN
jgi:hypothetical protein